MSICRALSVIPKRAMASQVTTQAGTPAAKAEQREKPVNVSQTPGYRTDPNSEEIYLNPLLTPPPRRPSTPEDFRHPQRLGHWRPLGFDYTSPVADKYYYHECLAFFFFSAAISIWLWSYGPDYKLREWARREAYLRTTKREALGLPLIDKDVVDPERIVLPTEEEIGDFPVTL